MVNFPSSLDTFTNPTAGNYLDDTGVVHHVQHSDANNAIAALEAKVGVDNSAVTTSLDYKVANKINKTDELLVSAGVYSLPTYTDNGNGTITLATGSFVFASTSDGNGPFTKFSINGATYSLTDNATNYIVGNYNGGSPIIQVLTSTTTINQTTIIPIYTIYREGNDLNILDWDKQALGLANKISDRLVRTERFTVEPGGLSLGEVATRLVTVGSGNVWYGATKAALNAFNSSTNSLYQYVHVAGVWTKTTVTQYNNTQYDNGTNAVNFGAGAGHYAVNWIFRDAATNHIECYMVLGTADYTSLAAAAGSTVPGNLPQEVSTQAILVGRIIVQKNASTASQIDSAFAVNLNLSATTNHASLSNLGWDVSGHTGTASNFATFDSSGVANYTPLSNYLLAATAVSTYVAQSGGNVYHTTAWTTAGTVSTSGTTVTGVGTSFTSGMVGAKAKIVINGESRIITAYSSATSVTVDSAFSTNYSGQSFAVYSTSYHTLSDGTFRIRNSDGGGIITSDAFSQITIGQKIFMWGDQNYTNATKLLFSNSSDPTGTKDTGIARNGAGALEVNNGTAGTYADLKLKTLSSIGGNITTQSGYYIGSGGYSQSIQGNGSGTVGSPWIFDIRSGNANSEYGDIRFITGNGTLTGERMRLLANGNLGIGIVTAATRLHIVGNSEDATPAGTYYGIMKIDSNVGTNDCGFKMGAKAGSGSNGYGFIQAVHTNVANDANLILNPTLGNVGVGVTAPGSTLHLKAGSATANTAPLQFTAGTVETTPRAGVIEFDGTDLFLSI